MVKKRRARARTRRKVGDRVDGRRLRTLESFNAMAPFMMRTKNDANNAYSDSVEITEVDKFLKAKRAEGYPGMGMLHIFIASYVRAVSQRPEINRFVSGQRIYARNRIEVVMVVKQDMTSKAAETSVKVALDPHDTISDIYRKINAEVEKIKANEQSGVDVAADFLIKFPKLVVRCVMSLLNLMDYFNVMPKNLIHTSLFHGSMFVTDLGSLGIRPVTHHLYNFGNIPLFLAFGAKRRVFEPQSDGSIAERKYVDYTLVTDDRITDGFYYSQCFKYLKSFMRHPQQLDMPPEKVFEDID